MPKFLRIAAVSTVALGAAALATDSPPPGFRADLDDGDIVNGLHKTQASPAARAEWRGTSTRSETLSFNGEMKVNGGANISIAQFLNVKGSGTTGSSEPISQLTVDDQRNGTYRVSIEQSDYSCGFRINKGQWYTVEAGIARNGVGWFKVGGKYCQRLPGNTDRFAGNPDDDQYNGMNAYYFKYGAYNAAGNSTASSVSWR